MSWLLELQKMCRAAPKEKQKQNHHHQKTKTKQNILSLFQELQYAYIFRMEMNGDGNHGAVKMCVTH